MDRLCTSCACKLSPASSTSLSGTSSLEPTIKATATLDPYQLDVFFRYLETTYDATQTEKCSQDIERFQSSGIWQEFHVADTWPGSIRPPTISHIPDGDNCGNEGYRLDIATSHLWGAKETSGSPVLSARKPETSSGGDYLCYQHGCEGRRFSSSENYRRHMRERNRSDVITCPFCATLFMRKSNRDSHVRKGRCKCLSRRLSERVDAQ
jgi:uncharacterized Zn-finger protein